jgi:subtilisin family serine protease
VVGVVHSTSQTTEELIASLQADPEVAYAEPDFIRHTFDLRPPNDARFGQLWGLRNTGQVVNGTPGSAQADIGFLKAWGLARVATNTVVAVIDTGVDVTHPDLIGNVWTNASEIPGNSVDDDGNGFADDAVGYDFVSNTSDPSDSGFHGTHVAGTIAAAGQNSIGVIGVAFRSQVMALKTSTDGDGLPDSAIIAAIDYCTMMKQRGTNIVAINASFGGPGFDAAMRESIEAAGEVGIIFCAAAGNSGSDNDINFLYPASYRLPNMIVVAASGQNDNLAGFSCFGATTVDLAAPGVNVLSSYPEDQGGTLASVLWLNTTYSAGDFKYSGTTTGITATIYDCGLGYPEDFPAAVSNNIALIQRGTLTFSDKVAYATAAGARAVIIYNNVSGGINGTLQFQNDWLPTVWISEADGASLAAATPTPGTVINAPDPSQIYEFLNGTSMATPHVAGAVGFVAMNFPAENVSQRVSRILQNVTPVTNLFGLVISGGRLNLARTVDTDLNDLPDWWEQKYFSQLTGTNPNADPDADGATNLAEWLAGTNPTNPQSVLRLAAVKNSGGLTVSWPSVAGRYYRLRSGPDASAGFPDLVLTDIVATPPFNTVSNLPVSNDSARYFRLEIEP